MRCCGCKAMIRVEDLVYEVGAFRMAGLDLSIAPGEYFVLLGPPGSGKTVFVECLAGLRRPQSGRITIGGRDVTGLEPRRRGVGYVPQDFGLFPHLSVRSNVAFGLKSLALSRAERRERVARMVDWLDIDHLVDRRTSGLSGGERQRVALARALAMEPKVLLLDEPVSALDEHTRQTVCDDLKRLQRELGITTVHVSHNQEEAFCVADRAAILHDGSLRQVGTMAELLRRPVDAFVARFMRCENILRGRVVQADGDHSAVDVAGRRLTVPGRHAGDLCFVIRPESVQLRPCSDASDPADALPVRIAEAADRGAFVRVRLDGDPPLVAHLSHAAWRRAGLDPGDKAMAGISSESVHVLSESPRR